MGTILKLHRCGAVEHIELWETFFSECYSEARVSVFATTWQHGHCSRLKAQELGHTVNLLSCAFGGHYCPTIVCHVDGRK